MAFVSVTRLKLRSFLYLLPFVLHTYRSAKQAKSSESFLQGKLKFGLDLTFWTMTMWKDEESMKKYRNSGAHLKAMPKLLNWCSEASVVSWVEEKNTIPTWKQAYSLLQQRGRLSKIKNPSNNHISKIIDEPNYKSKMESFIYPIKSQ